MIHVYYKIENYSKNLQLKINNEEEKVLKSYQKASSTQQKAIKKRTPFTLARRFAL